MIDHKARKQMADTIRSYLNEEIKSFRFSDALDEIRTQTTDETVDLIADELWCYYDDDYLSHKVHAFKEEWDYFHRLLLVLESDTELEVVQSRRWSPRQAIAACAVTAYAILALCLGWGSHLLVCSIPFGLVSMLLSCWRSREAPISDVIELALIPFASIPQLRAARRRVSFFSKERYPGHLMKRRIRHAILVNLIVLLPRLSGGIMWLVFSPIPLIFQTLPETSSKIQVKVTPQMEEQQV